MNRTDAPKKQAVPFAVNGQREDLLPTSPAGDNTASYDAGFPAVTMILKAAGGLPPKGQDMNQILFELASTARWSSAGAGYAYDAEFSTVVGGYPAGAKVLSTDGAGYWLNTSEANSANPEVTNGSLTGWVPSGFYGVTAITGLAASNVTLTSLQAARERIELSGALTANINIIVPAWQKSWAVVNNCTGSFTVTVKTPSGTGVTVLAGKKTSVYGNGTNVIALDQDATGRLLNIQTFNSSGTYTPTVGTKMIYVEVVGAGGAGAGSGGTSSNTLSGGSGGGGGGYASSLLTTVPSSAPVVIGVGGVGIPNDGGAGAAGGASSFNGTITATGGGGAGGTGGSVASSTTATQNRGGDGGIGSGGNLINAKGGVGNRSFFTSVNSSISGDGGASRLSFGPRGTPGASGVGVDAVYGAGGSGALSQGGTAALKGGNGGNGCVIIMEYS